MTDVLSRFLGSADLPDLARLANHDRPEVREKAVMLLYRCKDRPAEVIRIVRNAAKDRSYQVRRMAVFVPLHFGGADGVVDILIPALADRHGEADPLGSVAASAARSLSAVTQRSDEEITALTKALYSDDRSLSQAAVSSLAAIARQEKVTNAVVGHLIKAVEGGDDHLKIGVAHGLSVLGPKAKSASRPLIKVMETARGTRGEKGCTLFEAVVGALGQIGPAASAATPFLVRVLGDERRPGHDREAAANALWRIGDRSAAAALDALRSATRSADVDVKHAATMALRRLNTERPK